ncbi:MAG: metal-sensitive transcriptional regulator [Ferrimicrobium sp.]
MQTSQERQDGLDHPAVEALVMPESKEYDLEVVLPEENGNPELGSLEMAHQDEVDDLSRRLSRIEGQIRGIKRMVVEGRNCNELVTQFSAVSKALDQAALNFVTSQLVRCAQNPERALAEGYSIDEVKRLLMRLR